MADRIDADQLNTINFSMLSGRAGLQDRFLFVPNTSFLAGNVPGDSNQKYKRSKK